MKQLLLVLTCLGFSFSARAQFTAIIYNTTPLTTECIGGTPLGAGCWATIYWDQNSNGPDPADLPAPVGGGFGQANFNQIDMASGENLLGIPGGFATEDAFSITTNTPQPSRYFIKVECGGVVWTSVVFTILDGLRDYDLTEGWECCTGCNEVPCIYPTLYNVTAEDFQNNPVYSECIPVCSDVPVIVCFVSLPQNRRPAVEINSGCNFGIVGSCDVDCEPAQFIFDPMSMVYNSETRTWCAAFLPLTSGCVCLNAEILPVEESSFDAVPRDGAVLVTWATASETEVDYFKLKRDGQVVYTCAGSNSATGATYSYLDENLANGRTYSYSLETVNLDGTVEVWNQIATATPSLNSAVITEYALHQNFPNPFNPSTSIVFDVVEENFVSLTVFNLTGQEVATLVNGITNAGRHTVNFDATNLTSGLYFYTVKIGNEFTATKKMLLVK